MAKLFRFNFERVTRASADHYVLDSGVLVRGLLARKLLILDIEATGLDFAREEITEIAVQEYDPIRGEAGDRWQSYLRINGEIPPEISHLTSITKVHTESGVAPHQALEYLVSRYADHIWIAQCGFEFDFPFLERVYAESGLPKIGIDAIDPKIIFSLLHPDCDQTFSTNFLASHFGVDRSLFPRHTAAGDVALITEIVAGLIQEAREQDLLDIVISKPTLIRKFIPQPLP